MKFATQISPLLNLYIQKISSTHSNLILGQELLFDFAKFTALVNSLFIIPDRINERLFPGFLIKACFYISHKIVFQIFYIFEKMYYLKLNLLLLVS